MSDENQGRGFGGFGNMVSDVSDLAPRATPSPADDDEDYAPSIPTTPPKQSTAPLTKKGVIILLVVVGGIIGLVALNDSKKSGGSQTYTQPQPQESVPAVGKDNILSASEIRYCSAQNIRLDGAQTVIDHESQYAIDSFNSMIADYNSRCSSYRYQQRVLGAVKAEVESKRQQYFAEGVTQFPTGQVGPRSYR